MSNLLIVDDEKEILDWLEEIFKYECSMELDVYTANSAKNALELLNIIKFDVVMTDIRMPGMSGIKLYEHIRANWPNSKIIFLTGYRDFDNIYNVINDNNVKYLLKSESDEVIVDTVIKSFEEIKEMLEKKVLHKFEKESFKKAEYWLRVELFNELLEGRNISEITSNKLHEFNIDISIESPFLMCLAKIERDKDQKSIFGQWYEFEELSTSIRQFMPEQINFHCHMMEKTYFLILIQPKELSNTTHWNKIHTLISGALEYVQMNYELGSKKTISFVISNQVVEWISIKMNAEKLRRVMLKSIGGELSVFLQAEKLEIDYEHTSLNRHLDLILKMDVLNALLELRKRDEYFKIISEIIEHLNQTNSFHDPRAMELYYSLSMLLLRFINKNELNKKLAFEIGLYKLTKVDEHKTWIEASEYILELSNLVFDELGDNNNIVTDLALRRINDYINENLDTDLRLTKLAEIGGFNASYLSRLYKKVYNITISNYILDKRMDYAKELLANKSYKIQEIAEKVGYLSTHSFIRAFKVKECVSPGEYREVVKNTKK